MIDQRKPSSGLSNAIQSTLFLNQIGASKTDNKTPPEFTIKIANTLEERETVFNLGYQVYLEKGYNKEN